MNEYVQPMNTCVHTWMNTYSVWILPYIREWICTTYEYLRTLWVNTYETRNTCVRNELICKTWIIAYVHKYIQCMNTCVHYEWIRTHHMNTCVHNELIRTTCEGLHKLCARAFWVSIHMNIRVTYIRYVTTRWRCTKVRVRVRSRCISCMSLYAE